MNQSHITKRYHLMRRVWNIRCGHASRVYNNKPELYEELRIKAEKSGILLKKITARLKPTMKPNPDKYVLGGYDKKSNRSYSD